MSNVSTRVSNNNLIELVKQNYEKTQTSKIPGSIIELPSKGLVYPESSPLRSGTVEIRYMTAYDEDILTNGSYIKQGRKFRTHIRQTQPTLNLTYEFFYETTEGDMEAFQSTFPIGSDFFWI
jgi:hypothetical protein